MNLDTVGIAELRQNLSRHLEQVKAGRRLVVTDRNRPVATLGPPPGAESTVDRLIAEGRLVAPKRPGSRVAPVRLEGLAPDAASQALEELRGDRV